NLQKEELERVSTPHLDAQINIPLLLLAGAVAWRAIRAGGKARLWLVVALFLGGSAFWVVLRGWAYQLVASGVEDGAGPLSHGDVRQPVDAGGGATGLAAHSEHAASEFDARFW